MNKNIQSLKRVYSSRSRSLFVLAVLLFPLGVSAYLGSQVFAATMTQTSVVETNMDTSATSSLFVNFKAGAADAAGSLTITFPAGFTIASSQTVSTATCAAFFSVYSPTALPATTGSGSGQVITVTTTSALTSGNDYCFALTGASAVTNPASAGNYNTTLALGADTQTQGIDVISNDQIAVTASISQFFTLSFGANTDSITGASPSAYATSSGVTLTASTNATSGWNLWAEDTNTGLHSTNASHTIAAVGSNTNFSTTAGTEGYGITVTAVTGTGTTIANYNGTTNAYNGGPISSTTWNEFAKATATGTGTAQLKELLDVASNTPNATDYADTITVVGDGSF